MPFAKHPTRGLALLLSLTIATGCAARVKTFPLSPPAADLKAVTEAKPVPTEAIVASAQASEEYNAAVEAWGERVSAAGGRICRYVVDMGAKLPFACPKPKAPPR